MDMETMVSIGMALLEGIFVLFMMKFSGTSFAWRIISAIIAVPVGFFATKFIISR